MAGSGAVCEGSFMRYALQAVVGAQLDLVASRPASQVVVIGMHFLRDSLKHK